MLQPHNTPAFRDISEKKKKTPHTHKKQNKPKKPEKTNSQVAVRKSQSVQLDPGSSRRPLRLQQKHLLTVMISKIGPTSFLSDALRQEVRNHLKQKLCQLR